MRGIICRTQKLRGRGTTVEVYWVPGHMDVEGNKKANEVVKEAAEAAGTRRYPEQFSSLTHIGRTITERKLKEAKH